jgi:hypothetical protein
LHAKSDDIKEAVKAMEKRLRKLVRTVETMQHEQKQRQRRRDGLPPQTQRKSAFDPERWRDEEHIDDPVREPIRRRHPGPQHGFVAAEWPLFPLTQGATFEE